MCTLSYFRLSQGYSLMMNRDESPARPPAAGLHDDGARLYPVDPAAGGTWIGVNKAGAAFALMNQYPAGYVRPADAQSRGRLIPAALEAAGAGAGLERVAALDLSRTPPFLLAGFEEAHAPLSLRWDGRRLERRLYADGALMLSSSGFKPEAVLPGREAQFDLLLDTLTGADDAEVLAAQQAFQLSQQPEPGPYAVWMTRPDSRSVSLSHVLVLPRRVTLRHHLREDLEAGRPEGRLGLDR
jgi:hypothetical protein